ncbi:hypothetical protein F511_17409 [Dorcoceras hygrometricum]|uniref:Uncharacterized protein n=1 Tax=Dorcoceras hygrometricum TaxID=472368 RepID=A0A2Z7C7F9_9LAMI|nr:hypothetical protein F511_17409 [Dorcoceras hygrometricum]
MTAFFLRAKDSADGLCDDLKPADIYSYLESAVARFQQETSSDDSAATRTQQRCKFSSDANSAMTQIQQRHKFSSDADFIFSTKIHISRREARFFVQETPPVEIRKDFSRVQGRIHAVTVELREFMAN